MNIITRNVIRSATTASRRCNSSSGNAVNWRLRDNYHWFLPITTRWKDNDIYSHMNNANYHSVFDSTINVYLIRYCGLSIKPDQADFVGYMVKNQCEFFASAEFPAVYLAGLGISKIGNSSLTYKLALFPPKDESKSMLLDPVCGHFDKDKEVLNNFDTEAICLGEYIHVFVNPKSGNKPVRIPDSYREQLRKLMVHTEFSKL